MSYFVKYIPLYFDDEYCKRQIKSSAWCNEYIP